MLKGYGTPSLCDTYISFRINNGFYFSYPHKQSFAGYIGFDHPVYLSVCPPYVNMIFSTHVLGDGCMDFKQIRSDKLNI